MTRFIANLAFTFFACVCILVVSAAAMPLDEAEEFTCGFDNVGKCGGTCPPTLECQVVWTSIFYRDCLCEIP